MKIIGTKSLQKSDHLLTRGLNYIENNRLDKAISVLQREVKRYTSKEALLNLGCCYLMTGEHSLASAYFNKIPAAKFYNGTQGEYLEYYLNLGLLYYSLGDDDTAISIYREGIEQFKNHDLLWNYSIARLRQYCSNKYDDLAFCWQMYETRFQINNAVTVSSRVNWTGGVHVDSITVLAEQGVGDNIMFGRYLSEVSRWCDKLVVQCEKSANAIFAGYEVSNSLDISTTHCISMCSLGNLLDHIPAGKWISGYSVPGTGRVGCVWQSLNKHSNNRFRNTTASRIIEIAGDVDLYSLGPDCIDSRMPHLECTDWASTIEHLKTLDLVISIDSSIVHLCGSMGVPCILLLPTYNSDFRWGDASMGNKNVWYDSVKVIRSCLK